MPITPSLETLRGMVGNGMGFSLLVTRPTRLTEAFAEYRRAYFAEGAGK